VRPGGAQQIQQVGAVDRPLRVDEDDGAAVFQGGPHIEQAQVEVERRIAEHLGPDAQFERPGGPAGEAAHRRTAQRHDLGYAGRARRGQHQAGVRRQVRYAGTDRRGHPVKVAVAVRGGDTGTAGPVDEGAGHLRAEVDREQQHRPGRGEAGQDQGDGLR
jgi:hypothetical protein